jgi:hypothetical protein
MYLISQQPQNERCKTQAQAQGQANWGLGGGQLKLLIGCLVISKLGAA